MKTSTKEKFIKILEEDLKITEEIIENVKNFEDSDRERQHKPFLIKYCKADDKIIKRLSEDKIFLINLLLRIINEASK